MGIFKSKQVLQIKIKISWLPFILKFQFIYSFKITINLISISKSKKSLKTNIASQYKLVLHLRTQIIKWCTSINLTVLCLRYHHTLSEPKS